MFCTNREHPRREIRDTDLTVEKAKKFLEADEHLVETEAQLMAEGTTADLVHKVPSGRGRQKYRGQGYHGNRHDI